MPLKKSQSIGFHARLTKIKATLGSGQTVVFDQVMTKTAIPTTHTQDISILRWMACTISYARFEIYEEELH